MPRITALEPASGRGSWVDVHLDGASVCSLPKSAARDAGLSVGNEIDRRGLLELRDDAHRRGALDRSLRYLAHRPRSRAELERHLRGRGYVDSAIEAALDRCSELGYLDDEEFAAAHARDRIRLRPRARALMLSELRRRGVGDGDARAGIERAMKEEGVTEARLLERAARKAWRSLDVRDPEAARRRLLGYLSRRGFRAAESYAAVERLLAGRSE